MLSAVVHSPTKLFTFPLRNYISSRTLSITYISELLSIANMRFSTIIALFFSSLAFAAPVNLAVREAEAEAEAEAAPKPQYGDYGDYPAPS